MQMAGEASPAWEAWAALMTPPRRTVEGASRAAAAAVPPPGRACLQSCANSKTQQLPPGLCCSVREAGSVSRRASSDAVVSPRSPQADLAAHRAASGQTLRGRRSSLRPRLPGWADGTVGRQMQETGRRTGAGREGRSWGAAEQVQVHNQVQEWCRRTASAARIRRSGLSHST